MYDKIFENHCDAIIEGLGTSDIVAANSVVKLAIKASKKHPMLFLPAFIEDFVAGMPSSRMIDKYAMLNFNNLQSSVTLLKLKSRPHKDANLNAKDKNLQDQEMGMRYDFLSKYANLLYAPLEGLLNHNILRTLVSYSILRHTFIAGENLQDCVTDAYRTTNMRISILSNKSRTDSFEKYLSDDIYIKISDIISRFNEQGYVIVRGNDVSVTSKYENSVERVYNILRDETNGIRYSSLQRAVFDEFPLFRLAIPSTHVFEDILDMLESKNLLVRKKAFWKYSPHSDHLFATENYGAMMAKISKQAIESGRVKFFGRKIKPDLFLDEIKSLEYGDIGDEDDQVTRIAGLVLSDAAMLRSPHENMEEFDFVVDLKSYSFRPEQEEIMKKLDFRVESTIFHCKVMINEAVTPSVLARLADVLPAGEQGIVFTCVSIDSAVSDIIASDKTIQIINEDALREWCAITPVTPCRKDSVAKVRYGDNRGKIVTVKSLNYESGLATAETVLGGKEILIPIGSMEEMLPNISSLEDFEAASENYRGFLQLLASAAQDSFEKGINTHIVGVYDNQVDLLKNTNPELFDNKYPDTSYMPDLPYGSKPSLGAKYVQFNNVHAKIRIASSLNQSKCMCGHLLNEDSYRTLCTHLVAGIDHLCRNTDDVKILLENVRRLKLAFNRFKLENMRRSLNALSFALGTKDQILESYLRHFSNR